MTMKENEKLSVTMKTLPDGSRQWYRNDKRHREDGPAIEYAGGTRSRWRNDKRHREDGPAIEYADGTSEWWIDGKRVDVKDELK